MKNRIKNIHFVGIGGTGMCGIAEVLHNQGFRVSGSDQAENDTTRYLKSIGIRVFQGHFVENVKDAEVVVTSTAIRDTNPEVQAALSQYIPVIPRAMMLAELMRFHNGIAIAGTHGKTTTTSLMASVFGAAQLDPTFVIGGKLTAAGANAKLGKGSYLIAEADESDASFLYLTPLFTVVTNIDEDHMDTYDHSVQKLYQAFIEFIHRMPFYGKAFLCIESEHVRAILPEVKKPFLTYGLSKKADIYASDIQAVGIQMHFTVQFKDQELSPFPIVLNFPGEHSVLNALAVIAVALECKIPVPYIQQGLQEFSGVGRRFQSYGEITLADQQGHALIIDDYGHHPVEMEATISAARQAFPDRRLILAFQPHRYTRTRDLFEEFVDILKKVDGIVLTEVYAAGEEAIVAADSKALARAIRVNGQVEPIYEADVTKLHEVLYHNLQDNDVLLVMGAGNINAVPSRLVAYSQQH